MLRKEEMKGGVLKGESGEVSESGGRVNLGADSV